MDYNAHFINQLKNYRKKNNLTQDDLAEILCYSQKNIAKWEQGFALPPIEILIKLSKMMGISLNDLLGLKENPILQNCIDYIINAQGLEKNATINLEYEKETIKDVIYGNVSSLYIIFCQAIIHNESFKELIQKHMHETYELAIEFFKKNEYIIEKNGEWLPSYEFALECFNFCESDFNKKIVNLKKDINEYDNYYKNGNTTKIDAETRTGLSDLLEYTKNEKAMLIKAKEDYLTKNGDDK